MSAESAASAGLSGWSSLPAGFLAPGPPSILDFLARHVPGALPSREPTPAAKGAAAAVPHGTTIVAATYADGVLMAGDRRITMGNLIANRDAEKVFAADEHTALGISGTVGFASEMVRLFRLELEHYEKVETVPLSLPGKVNRLTRMIREHLPLAMQGLGVIPLFAGYDTAAGRGRIFSFDITGAHHEEHGFAATGSGSPFAHAALKKLYRPNLGAREATAAAIQALYDAADDDSATGGPDPVRRTWPLIVLITAEGLVRLTDEEAAEASRAVLSQRGERPDGPGAGPL